jgi:hypothetical protein
MTYSNPSPYPSPYQLFMGEHRDGVKNEIIQQMGTKDVIRIHQRLTDMWNQCDEKTKQIYKDRAKSIKKSIEESEDIKYKYSKHPRNHTPHYLPTTHPPDPNPPIIPFIPPNLQDNPMKDGPSLFINSFKQDPLYPGSAHPASFPLYDYQATQAEPLSIGGYGDPNAGRQPIGVSPPRYAPHERRHDYLPKKNDPCAFHDPTKELHEQRNKIINGPFEELQQKTKQFLTSPRKTNKPPIKIPTLEEITRFSSEDDS